MRNEWNGLLGTSGAKRGGRWERGRGKREAHACRSTEPMSDTEAHKGPMRA